MKRRRHHRHHGHSKPAAKPAANLGLSPTNAQKLIYIANKLGLPGIAQMQGSTVNLFDTVLMPTNASPQIISFFSAASTKPSQFSNFQQGNLRAGEAMIIERLAFFLITINTTALTAASAILDIVPIASLNDATSQIGAGDAQVQFPGSLKMAQCQINIANQVVVKTFNLFEGNPEFNPLTTGVTKALISTAALPASTSGVNGQNVIPLEAPPVLPPNLTLQIDFATAAIGTVTPPSGGAVALVCVAGRFGSIFASKGTL
jgi:hypothetical protein